MKLWNLLPARAGMVIGVMGLAQISGAARLPAPAEDIPLAPSPVLQSAVVAGGDFSVVEAVFRHVKGVSSVVSGYAGGTAATADYAMVGRGMTGHAESVQITYDPAQISYGKLLQVFFSVAHDPMQLNQQGPDVGKQYRSVIFTTSNDESRIAKAYIAQLEESKAFSRPIVTQVLPLPAFYPAEGRYQNYADLNRTLPYVARYIQPKLAQLKEEFPELYTERR